MFAQRRKFTTHKSAVAHTLTSRPGCDEVVPGMCGPQILIIGAMKCGTNAISEMLLRHSQIKLHLCSRPPGFHGGTADSKRREDKRNEFLNVSIDTKCGEDQWLYQGELAHRQRGGKIVPWDSHPFTFVRHGKEMYVFLVVSIDKLPADKRVSGELQACLRFRYS